MKRSLRSRNSCLPIQNFFRKEIQSEFSEIVGQLPEEILNKLSKKKFVLCEDVLCIELANRPNQQELERIKLASKLLKQKCDRGLQKMRKIQQRPTINNSSFFDCLLNQDEIPRKIIKCEPLSYEVDGNNRNKMEYKIQYNDQNDEVQCINGESYLNFVEKGVENIIQHEEMEEKEYK